MTDLAIFILNLNFGGAEKNAVILANEFSKKGKKVDLVLLDDTGVLIKNVLNEVNIINLKTNQIRYSFYAIAKYLYQKKPRRILVFMFPYTLLVSLISKIISPKTKIVVTERTTINEFFFKGKYKKIKMLFSKLMMRMIYPFATSVVLVSQKALNGLKEFIQNSDSKIKFQVINNPCFEMENNIFEIEEQKVQSWISGAHKKILAVGRLNVDKDFITLIQAFSLVSAEMNAKLIIVGEGLERKNLESLVNILNLKDKVIFAGFQKNVSQFYQVADLFVLSSIREGMPNVLLEALQFGLNIVSTNCDSGPSEILNEGQFGILVPVKNITALKEGIILGLKKPLAKEFLKSRADDFSLEKTILAYEKVLFCDGS